MRNKPRDLHNHLFEQLERLNDEDLIGKDLDFEIKRSKAMIDVASKIIDNGRLILDVQKTVADFNGREKTDLELLNG